jgi:hypothetical protein
MGIMASQNEIYQEEVKDLSVTRILPMDFT